MFYYLDLKGFGIKTKTLENSDFKFKININNNIESLNISNTVSIVCHHIFQKLKKLKVKFNLRKHAI